MSDKGVGGGRTGSGRSERLCTHDGCVRKARNSVLTNLHSRMIRFQRKYSDVFAEKIENDFFPCAT